MSHTDAGIPPARRNTFGRVVVVPAEPPNSSRNRCTQCQALVCRDCEGCHCQGRNCTHVPHRCCGGENTA